MRFSDFLSPIRRKATIDPEASYKMVTLPLYGKGARLRKVCFGSELGTARFEVRTGDLMISKIDARKGSNSLLPPELDGAVVTGDFLSYVVDEAVVSKKYFSIIVRSAAFADLCDKVSAGTTNRVRLDVHRFLELKLTVPPLDEQRRIVDLIGAVDDAIESANANRQTLDSVSVRSLASAYAGMVGTPLPLESVFSHVIGGSWGSEPGAEDTDVVAIGPSAYANGHTEVDAALGSRRSLSFKRAAVRTIQAGDVVLERSGGSPTQPVGRVIRGRNTPPNVVPSDFMRLLRPDTAIVDPSYVFWVMWLMYKQDAPLPFQKFTTGIRNLNIPQYLTHTKIILPVSREDQSAFCELAESFLSVSNEQESHAQSLRSLRAELLSALLSGAHRMPETYDELMGA